jgi:hypothetical protein
MQCAVGRQWPNLETPRAISEKKYLFRLELIASIACTKLTLIGWTKIIKPFKAFDLALLFLSW